MERFRFNYKVLKFNFFLFVNFLISQPKYFYVDFENSFSLKEKDFFKFKFFFSLYINRNLNCNYFFSKQIVLCKKIIFFNFIILNLISF